jgi:hypothetical protein
MATLSTTTTLLQYNSVSTTGSCATALLLLEAVCLKLFVFLLDLHHSDIHSNSSSDNASVSHTQSHMMCNYSDHSDGSFMLYCEQTRWAT